MRGHDLTSVADVFQALGGVDRVIALTGSRSSAAMNRKAFGAFPAKTSVALTRDLQRQGKRAPASLRTMAEAS